MVTVKDVMRAYERNCRTHGRRPYTNDPFPSRAKPSVPACDKRGNINEVPIGGTPAPFSK